MPTRPQDATAGLMPLATLERIISETDDKTWDDLSRLTKQVYVSDLGDMFQTIRRAHALAEENERLKALNVKYWLAVGHLMGVCEDSPDPEIEMAVKSVRQAFAPATPADTAAQEE